MGLGIGRSKPAVRHRTVSVVAAASLWDFNHEAELEMTAVYRSSGEPGGAKAQERTISMPSMVLWSRAGSFPGSPFSSGVAARY
jgi:hypothetical protein